MKPCKITVDLYNTFRERMPEYVQYDRNVPLEITVLENGKPADLNGLFGRLLVSKPDGHEVYSNDVEINGNVITTILGEQVFTASGVAQVTVDILDEQNSKRALIPFGMRIRSAVITDESIKSSNDYQTITALISDVRALDAMFHVEQEQRAEAFNAQMQSQEATFTETQRQFLADHREAMFHVEQQMTEQAGMFHVEQTERAEAFEQSEADREQRFETQTTEWARTVEQAEATRQFNEERRQSAESKRESAEKARESAERQRVDTEAVRQRQEQERGQGEAGRATAEANRVKAEQTRVDNESSRKSAESSRVNAESQRATAESHRVTAETSRANAESQRVTAETNRAGAEGRRSEAESNRVTAETSRATAESNRVTAENTRETQENARREAEEDRATRMAQWEAKAEETAQKAQEAVDSAQAFVNVNEERLLTDRDKIDYWGNHHANMKDMTDATVDKILGDFNILNHTGEYITATETIARHVPRGTLKGHTEVNCIQEPSGADIVLPYDFEPSYDVMINDTKETGALGIELKGQTLVNSIKDTSQEGYGSWNGNITMLDGGWIRGIASASNNHFELKMSNLNLKPSTTYMYIIECRKNTFSGNGQTFQFGDTYKSYIDTPWTSSHIIKTLPIGTYTFKLTTKSDFSTLVNPVGDRSYLCVGSGEIEFRYMIIEYQEGMENWDIPYFEGMASVTTPTVTTMGKNLFDSNVEITMGYGINSDTGAPYGSSAHSCTGFLRMKPNTTYAITQSHTDSWAFAYDRNKNYIGLIKANIKDGSTFTTPNGTHYIRLDFLNTDISNIISTFCIEEGNTSTGHEPFKSSSLTLPEEIVLRSLPNSVCDTYNVQTGEYMQRIGELVFDGSDDEDWRLLTASSNWVNFSPSVCTFVFPKPSNCALTWGRWNNENSYLTNRFPAVPSTDPYAKEDKEKLIFDSTNIKMAILKTSLKTEDVEGLRIWLSQNPIITQYELAMPIITKVPLDQFLKSWNTTTHIESSVTENSLKPIIAPVNPSYDVMLKPSTQYSIITNPIANGHTSTPIEFNLGGATVETVIGNRCTLITTPSALTHNKLEMSGRGQKLQGGMMVLEGNKTGMIFGHFDGIKSVNCFTLKARSKNLLDADNTIKGYWVDSASPDKIGGGGTSARDTVDYIPVKPGEYLYLSNAKTTSAYGYSDIGRYVSNIDVSGKAPIPNGVRLLRLTLDNTIDYSQGQLEYGKSATEFAPHQSNSLPLTIPMRSLPNGVCDTLDLLTGEYVQKVYEYTFTGEERISDQAWGDQRRYSMSLTDNNLPMSTYVNIGHCNMFMVGDTNRDHNAIILSIEPNSIRIAHPSINLSTFKEFLRSNMVTFQYGLAEPIITKLDLQWKDGKLFAYDGTTHFFVDVEGGQLMPILDIDVPVNLAQRTSRLCAEKEQLEAEKAQLANEVSVLQLRNTMLKEEMALLEQSNKDLQQGQARLIQDNQELTHTVTIIDEHREEGDLELLSSDFDFELRLMEIEFAIGVSMMSNYKGVRNMARTPYDMAKALILGGKYEREEMITKLDRFEKLGSITADQKAELIALMDAVDLTR